MIVVIWIAIGILAASVLVGLVRVATAEDAASRAVIGDLVYFSAIGIMVLESLISESAVVLDAAVLASILGILATIALSRILTRGGR